jgi:hypothetical protein
MLITEWGIDFMLVTLDTLNRCLQRLSHYMYIRSHIISVILQTPEDAYCSVGESALITVF